MAPGPLRENPIFRQQALRFRRLGPRWWVPMAAVWLLATWFLRFRLSDFLMANVTAGQWTLASSFGLLFLNFMLRADVALIVLTGAVMMQGAEWRELRPHLALSALTPREVFEGLLPVPFALLAGLNLVGAPFFYLELWEVAAPEAPSRTAALLFGLVLGVMAFAEDLFFGAVCLLAVQRERIAGGHTPLGLLAALGTILRTGAVVGLLAALQILFEAAVEDWPVSPFLRLLGTNLASMSLVLLFELAVVRRLYLDGVGRTEAWLRSEED